MSFFERYSDAIAKTGIDPCSQKAAKMFGVTKASLSIWNTKGTTPMGDTVARIADQLHVSADYLLGRTDDPTDYCTSDQAHPQSDRTVSKTVPFPQPYHSADDVIMQLYARLDDADRLKAQGVIQGMLMQDKYTMALNAAHTRTDIPVTGEMVTHDEDIMDDKDF